MDDYLTKPLSKPALLEALARWSTPNANANPVVIRELGKTLQSKQ
jgi:CheY-like chemotaxis protein